MCVFIPEWAIGSIGTVVAIVIVGLIASRRKKGNGNGNGTG